MPSLFEMLNLYIEEQRTLSTDELLRNVLDRERQIPPTLLKPKSLMDARNLLRISESVDRNDVNLILKAHTDGLCFSPQKSSIAGIHYARRALVLQNLKLYKEALQDIDLALEQSIPTELKQDLNVRKKIIIELLEKSEVQVAEEEILLSYGENSSIPGASKAINFAYNEVDGRHLIATQPMKIGDTLMIQKPYAYLALQDPEDPALFTNPAFVCHNCLQYTLAPIPCEKCIRASYCSIKCRSEAYDKFHRIECQLPSTNDDRYNLGLRLLLIMTEQGKKMKEVLNFAKEQQNSGQINDNLQGSQFDANDVKSQFDANDVKTVLNLPHYMDEFKEPTFTCNAGILASNLKKRTDIVPNNMNTFTLGKFVLRVIHTAFVNSLKIRRKSNSDIVAYGLYPLLNQMKHSCVQNTIMYNDNDNKKIVCAVRDIEAGEKITFSGICHEDILKMNVNKRKDFIRTLKRFNCKCEACEKDYVFKFELTNKVKVPEDLKQILKKDPKNLKALWELLKLIHDQCKSPCREAKLIELGILDAFMGKANTQLSEAFGALGII